MSWIPVADQVGTQNVAMQLDDGQGAVVRIRAQITCYLWACNRAASTHTGAATGQQSLTYTYDANDHLTNVTGAPGYSLTYTYDSNGNTLTVAGSQQATYTWNLENRRMNVSSTISGVSHTISDQYDDARNRVSETVDGQTNAFLNDPSQAYDQVLEEYSPGNAMSATYVRGLDLILQDRSGVRSYYLKDGQGSTWSLSNSSGVVTDNYDFDGFGNLLFVAGSTINPYLFAGERYDSAEQQYYTSARHYNPTNGRFLSRDTVQGNIFDPMSMNLFVYASSNPINRIDPSGHDDFSLGSLSVSFSVQTAFAGGVTDGIMGAADAYVHGGDTLRGALLRASIGALGGGFGANFCALPGNIRNLLGIGLATFNVASTALNVVADYYNGNGMALGFDLFAGALGLGILGSLPNCFVAGTEVIVVDEAVVLAEGESESYRIEIDHLELAIVSLMVGIAGYVALKDRLTKQDRALAELANKMGEEDRPEEALQSDNHDGARTLAKCRESACGEAQSTNGDKSNHLQMMGQRERRLSMPGVRRKPNNVVAKLRLILWSLLATISVAFPVSQEKAGKPSVAGSPVLKTKRIEDVRAGEKVWSRDVRTGVSEARKVVSTYHRISNHIRKLKVRTDANDVLELSTTDEHPFWVAASDRWVNAGQLAVGQRVSQFDAGSGEIISSEREDRPEGVPVFNFEVDGFHTYFVGQAGILVHNANYGNLSFSGFKERFASTFSMVGPPNPGDTLNKALQRGYYWYEKAFNASGPLVIGSLADTRAAAKNGAGSILSALKWNLGINDSWVEGGIARGAEFILATNVNTAQFINGKTGGLSVYAREILQLLNAGYNFSSDFKKLLPPTR